MNRELLMTRTSTPSINKSGSSVRSRDRSRLLAKGPSSTSRRVAFAFALVLVVATASAVFAWHDLADLGVAMLLSVATLIGFVLLSPERRKRNGRRPSLAFDVVGGILFGLLIVATTQVTGSDWRPAGLFKASENSKFINNTEFQQAIQRTTSLVSAKDSDSSQSESQGKEANASSIARTIEIIGKAVDASTIRLWSAAPEGRFTLDLTSSDLRVFSQNVEVTDFSIVKYPSRTVAIPASVLFLIPDASDSETRNQVERILQQIVRSNPYASYRVCTYGQTFRILTPWTRTISVIAAASRKLNGSSGSHLADAIASCAGMLSEKQGRRLIVAFGGVNETATPPKFDLVGLCLEQNVRVFELSLGDRSSRSPDWLEGLTVSSNGSSFDHGQLTQFYTQIRSELTKQEPTSYAIEFRQPPQWPLRVQLPQDGSMREVFVNGPE